MNNKRILSAILAAIVLGPTTSFAEANNTADVTETAAVETSEPKDVSETETRKNGYYEPGGLYITDGLVYTELSDGTLQLIGYQKEVSCVDLITYISIPSTAFGKKVTSIRKNALWESPVKTLRLPETLTDIEDEALDCDGLVSITVNENNPVFSSEGGVLLSKDKTKLIRFPKGREGLSYTIPDCVTSIGEMSFYDCTKIASIIIPDNVKRIEMDAFVSCTNIRSIEVPSSVTYIGAGAFRVCPKLKSATIKANVDILRGETFSECSALESVELPNSIKSICAGDFYKCTSLKSISIPENVTSIESSFMECNALTTVYIPKSVTSIGWFTFSGCYSLKDVYYGGSADEWGKITIGTDNDPLLKANIHYNSTEPVGVEVSVVIKAPEGADISGQTATTTVNGETKPLTITDGKLNLSGLTDGTYTFTFKANNCVPRTYKVTVSDGAATGLESGVELHLIGDINGDGKINTTDILKAKLQTKGSNKLDGYDLAVADANKDGKVNGTDVLKLKLHAKGSTKLW